MLFLSSYLVTHISLRLKARLESLWKLKGRFDLANMEKGFTMVKVDRREDREHIFTGGPWMIFNHYLVVMPLSRDFPNSNQDVTKATSWIRFPGLSFIYYDKAILKMMASMIRKHIKVDVNTKNYSKVGLKLISLNRLLVGLSLMTIGKQSFTRGST